MLIKNDEKFIRFNRFYFHVENEEKLDLLFKIK